jgi:hypothetical protein
MRILIFISSNWASRGGRNGYAAAAAFYFPLRPLRDNFFSKVQELFSLGIPYF